MHQRLIKQEHLWLSYGKSALYLQHQQMLGGKKDTRTDVVFFFKLIFVLWMRKLYAAQENECTSICRNCALFIHYDIYTHECLFMLLHALLMRCLSPKGICVKEKTPKRNTCIRHIYGQRDSCLGFMVLAAETGAIC